VGQDDRSHVEWWLDLVVYGLPAVLVVLGVVLFLATAWWTFTTWSDRVVDDGRTA
jgi:hypothetical protein